MKARWLVGAAVSVGVAVLVLGAFLLARVPDGDGSPGGVASAPAALPAEVPSAPRALPAGDGPGAATAGAAPAAADGAPPDAPGGRLRVKVVAHGAPVADAEVRLYRRPAPRDGEPWRASAQGVTASDGTLLVAAPPGAWLVTAAARGLARAHAEVARPAGEALTEIGLRLEPAVALQGVTVERGGGAPVPLATLSCAPLPPERFRRLEFPVEERAFATSDARGAFRLAGLAPGWWSIEARAPGHATRVVRARVPASRELRVELAAAASIEGIVTRDGKPVPGAAVTIAGAGDPVALESGASGRFAAEVDPGVHRVSARMGEECGSADAPVVAAAGSTVRGVEVRLGAGARVAGTVRSGAAPVAGATVTASASSGGATAAGTAASPATTSADGAYELRDLPPGSYTLTVAKPGRATATFPDVTLRAGERFRLDVVLADAGAVEGLVTDARGAPVAGALVTASGGWFRGVGAPTAPALAARTDAAGHYRLEGVPPGPLRVSARRDEVSPVASRTVAVQEGTLGGVDLVLVDGGAVAGTVRDQRGEPIPGATVMASGGRGDGVRQVTAAEDGSYALLLAPGTYELAVSRPDAAVRGGARAGVRAGAAQVIAGRRAEVDLVVRDDAPEPRVAPAP